MLREALPAAAVHLRRPFRPSYMRGPVTMELPMPATPDDIASIRQIANWAKRHKLTPTERMLHDALQRALTYLEEPDSRKTIMLHILSALRHSMTPKVGDGGKMWVTVDRDLHNWAMEQIEQMFPNAGHAERVTLSDPTAN